jgi:hypothetical protein
LNDALAAELAAMVERDQELRNRVVTTPGERPRMTAEHLLELSRVDVAHTDRLREIVDEFGWPGRSLVGAKGAHDAWLLAQHADKQLDFQRRVLALLEEAVTAGEAEPKHLAYLTDRVRIAEGRPQLYGTQMFGAGDGDFGPFPIEDEEHVDERRAAVGLEPVAGYIRRRWPRDGKPSRSQRTGHVPVSEDGTCL